MIAPRETSAGSVAAISTAPHAVATAATVVAAGPKRGKGKDQSASSVGSAAFVPVTSVPLGTLPSADGVDLSSSVAESSLSKAGRMRRLPTHLQDMPTEKLVRLNEHMRKCLSVLKDLTKIPVAQWFLVPVDWRSLNLPDYLKVRAFIQPVPFECAICANRTCVL
jgi:hypothetical protein